MRPLACSALLIVALSGCGGAPPPDLGGAPDAGLSADATAPAATPTEVEVGTGEDGFAPVEVDQAIDPVLGPQGGGRFEGYHVTSAVRTRGLDRTMARVTFRLLAEDGAEVGRQVRVFDLERRGADLVAYGVRPRLTDCCLVAGKPMTMAVEVIDREGREGRDERRVVAGPCLDDRGRSVCP
jgi:hypothetical protein